MRIKLLAIVFALSLTSLYAAYEDQITITTYYPSPYGSYNELRTYNSTYLATQGGQVGIGTETPQAKLDVNGGIKVGSDASVCSAANAGIIRYNTTSNVFEFCNGATWTSAAGGFSNFTVFDANGTFTVPSAVTKIMVEVWGAGGGGAFAKTAPSNCAGGGGGGAGGYVRSILNVLPGTNYNVAIGTGGSGGSLTDFNGHNGANSTFGSIITAQGGTGGSTPVITVSSTLAGTGGAGGCGSSTQQPREVICGSPGGSGDYNYDYDYGANGGIGGSAAKGGGSDTSPGGGATGEYAYASSVGPGGTHSVGSGSNGRVIVSW